MKIDFPNDWLPTKESGQDGWKSETRERTGQTKWPNGDKLVSVAPNSRPGSANMANGG